METPKESNRTILVVDDNPQNIQLAATHLKEEGYRIAFSQHGLDAIEKAKNTVYDLILLDIMMPEIDGFEVCSRIKALPEYKDIPIIFLTAKADKQSIVRGLDAGAVDYVAKPFFGKELLARVRTHLRIRAFQEKLEEINAEMNRELLKSMKMAEDLEKAQAELQQVNRQLYDRATKDPLTGLFNRRKMIDLLEYERERSKRKKTSYSVIICDIDHFKKVNDSYGHDCGDLILQQVTEKVCEMIREQDQLARWGGEEFLLLLPETDEEGAHTLSEKVRKSIEDDSFSCPSAKIAITMTFGIAVAEKEEDPDRCIKKADIALYNGKTGGRNQSVVFKPDMEQKTGAP
jgi:diguanylate cyclase (GGDEF)-like protein